MKPPFEIEDDRFKDLPYLPNLNSNNVELEEV